ncbi:MAG: hypothetical protein RL728_223 [Bacteroidota bacterium]|jgi:hypothetical protein
MKLTLLTLFILLSTLINAQTNGKGIVIVKDKKIDALIQNKSNVKRINTTGYRVQVYFSTNKNELNDVRLKFIKSYPRVETYITYDAPNYFLRVGDYADRNDAERFKKEIFREFPDNFIVKCGINLPNDEEEEDSIPNKQDKESSSSKKKKI